jgi:hypothetical protein
MRIGLVQDLDSGRPSLVRGGVRRVADGHHHPEVLLETGSAVLQDPYRIESANALDSATTSAV